jgi:5-methyltetrahydropteroyltriglutamate--homocysteine methyltransferase
LAIGRRHIKGADMGLTSASLGFPRMGEFRELKKAVEAYWKGEVSASDLNDTAKQVRVRNWKQQQNAGIRFIPSNDFSFYDQMLDMSCLLGNVPARFNWSGGQVDLDTLFTIARGNTSDSNNNQYASEMTKWFDTNYHYIVPEFDANTQFSLATNKIFDEFTEAQQAGITTRPVLVGPVTYLKLGKVVSGDINKYDLLDNLLAVYTEVLKKCEALGVTDIQLDEPIAVLDLTAEEQTALTKAYTQLSQATSINLHVTTYFGDLRDNQDVVFNLPVKSIHLDAVRGQDTISATIQQFPTDKQLSIGVVNGRNIWKNNYQTSIQIIKEAVNKVGEDNVIVAASCSLLHSPVSLANETELNAEIKQWMAFADEKLVEISTLARVGLSENADELNENKRVMDLRATSSLIHNPAVKERVANIKDQDFERENVFATRQKTQQEYFNFPLFPTTTIGSFPQTKEVRQQRAAFKKGTLSEADYDIFLKDQVKASVEFQEEIGIDVLVHGEFERNDMVEYFGEQLDGFTFTKFGWVQSYGSRCVKPPVIFGDVSRPKAMTVEWSAYAQSLTETAMKGMLTGPVTILQWSFVRDDQPRKDTTYQIGLAIRDEVCDLEAAGIKVIQIDEPAIREGLPLRQADWNTYLTWSVNAFKLSAAGVVDDTQIHTHMCYSEFNDIIDAIARMDADVISIETSRSNMELLDAFVNFNYPNEVGPGVYDIHSPRIPSQQNMSDLLKKAADVLPVRNIWVNPDCGLKTRGWPEVRTALENMVQSAKELREAFKEVATH